MARPVLPVQKPAILDGQRNGELDPSILWATPGRNGGPLVRLVPTAARCWRAMAGTAAAIGLVLQTTSVPDSYRSLTVQKRVFTERYTLEPVSRIYRLWDSDGNGTKERWYKYPGVASAAVPGTSNHGLGIALDVANVPEGSPRLRWLEANAVRFGWSWELPNEEPWHLRNHTGDNIPAAVLAYEDSQAPIPAPLRSNGALDMLILAAVLPATPVGSPPTSYWIGDGFGHRELSKDNANGLLVALRILYNLPDLGFMQWPGESVETVLNRIGPVPYPIDAGGGAVLMAHTHPLTATTTGTVTGRTGDAEPTP